jgi:hypothetical protein
MPFRFHRLRRDTLAIAKPAWGKGVRSTGAQSATHPCGAVGASGNAVVWDLRMLRAAIRRAPACFAFSHFLAREIVTGRPRPGFGAWGGQLHPSRA